MQEQSMTAQQRFDTMYISSAEICNELSIGRTSVLNARRKLMLPDPVLVNNGLVWLWEREKVRPILDEWKAARQRRQAVPA